MSFVIFLTENRGVTVLIEVLTIKLFYPKIGCGKLTNLSLLQQSNKEKNNPAA